jgi:PQQ-dependent catabolism-associated CXXCW motif protein
VIRAAALGVVLALASLPAAAEAPPEPEGYRTDNYRAPTPATLAGARPVATQEAAQLWRDKTAVFIDVMPRPPRPTNLPPETFWRSPPRSSIPGAIWLPNVGFGNLALDTEAYFRNGLDAATQGDQSRPIVIFCMRDCWMSWNAAKRARAYGYATVHWFSDGTDGWIEAGLPLTRVEPAD